MEQALVSQATIDNQIVIAPDKVACSLYPSSNGRLQDGLQDASGSRLSQTLNGPMSSHSAEMHSQGRNTPTSPHISGPGNSYLPMYTMHLVSSPIADTHRPANLHHRLRGYRSDSTESMEQLGSGEMSSSRDMTLVAPSHLSFDVNLPHQQTSISNQTSLKTQACPSGISPVAPKNFARYEKRRKV